MDSPTTEQPRGSGGPPPPRPDGPRQLRRLPDRGPIGGVCAGVAEYFNVDPIIVRIAAVVLLVTGPGAIAYILAWIFVPAAEGGPTGGSGSSHGAGDRGMQVLGIVLLVIALSVLWGDWWGPGRRLFFPLALIALGVWLLLRRDDRRTTPPATPGGVPTAWSQPGDPGSGAPTARAGDDEGASTPTEVQARGVSGEETTADEAGHAVSAMDEEPTAAAEPAAATRAAWTAGPATTAAWHAGDETHAGWAGSGETGTVSAPNDETAAGWAATDATTETDVPPSGTGAGSGGDGPPTAAYPWGGPPPAQPERSRRRRLVPPIVLGALLIWAGIAWLIGATLVTSLAVALCIIGVGIVVGAIFGGSWALVPAAALVGAALVFTSVVDIPLSGPIGDRTWRPMTLSEVDDDYEMSIGKGRLDLTGLDLAAGEELELQGSVGVGHLIVEVPESLSLDVEAQTGIGEIVLLDVRNNGIGVEDRRTYDAGARSPTVHLDLEVGIGQIEVIQVPVGRVEGGSGE